MKNLLLGVRITAYARLSFLDPDYRNQTNTKKHFCSQKSKDMKRKHL